MSVFDDRYASPSDLPAALPLFPLEQALLLPRGTLPLNVFEPRYLAMVDAALSGTRVIGMIQPAATSEDDPATGKDADARPDHPALERVGCAGRITSYSEVPDGRYLITLTGISRFAVMEEIDAATPYRQAAIDCTGFATDLVPGHDADAVDRPLLLKTLANYLKANDLDVDWDAIGNTPNEILVNSLAMISPFGRKEKQALLEAHGTAQRAEILIALTEMALAQTALGDESRLQ